MRIREWSLRVFFFKQKSAYDLRISDWSSDVCSSELVQAEPLAGGSGFSRVSLSAACKRACIFTRLRHNTTASTTPSTASDSAMPRGDRKSDAQGKSVSVRVDPGGRRIIKKKKG